MAKSDDWKKQWRIVVWYKGEVVTSMTFDNQDDADEYANRRMDEGYAVQADPPWGDL